MRVVVSMIFALWNLSTMLSLASDKHGCGTVKKDSNV